MTTNDNENESDRNSDIPFSERHERIIGGRVFDVVDTHPPPDPIPHKNGDKEE
jgi:hypothetical protein